ncbi:GTPase of the mitochondrial inner membrane that associates with the large ribosomal subunit [Diatrype stigma]|uniref:GTPase of the mitochondrial inner membrane that associates with the large ribosomal subunit n=1 Tax=Diatrype stigma TaxID=117547 RepID=A0AAN9US36_9PEZI
MMASRCAPSTGLFLPFLYPSLFRHKAARIPISRFTRSIAPLHTDSNISTTLYDATSSGSGPGSSGDSSGATTTAPDTTAPLTTDPSSSSADLPTSRLNPAPDDYAISTFADKARVTVHAGGGGHGCVSFLREMFLAEGPANGGDGGHGGSVYIQAVAHGETSLHRLARGRRSIRAGRGKSGMGDARGGARGDDLLIKVPVGTVVREVERQDPVADEVAAYHAARKQKREYDRLVQEAEEAAATKARAEAENAGVSGEGAVGSFNGRGSRRRADDKKRKIEDGDDGFISSTLAESEAAARAALGLTEDPDPPNLHKFILYPGMSPGERQNLSLPRYPRRERLLAQPEAPIRLDLTAPTARPILLAAGGLGGLGNPHFVSKERPRPLFATRGEGAVSVTLDFELKLLADVGLVGLPNAGKSTLLRALTRSRARVGNWAFTTLQPNIGTVVLDNHKGRPVVPPAPKPSSFRPSATTGPFAAIVNDASSPSRFGSVVMTGPDHHIVCGDGSLGSNDAGAGGGGPRTRFTVADIPGLIEGAHLDRGLGVAFLRHVERAGVLAFVVDLGAGDAIAALKALWAEVGLYARMREEEENEREIEDRIDWEGDGSNSGLGIGDGVVSTTGMDGFTSSMSRNGSGGGGGGRKLDIAAKPWFVVATKGDLPSAQDNYARLREYLDDVTAGREPHPSGVEDAWTDNCAAIPVSAIHGHGVDRIVHWVVGLLDQ